MGIPVIPTCVIPDEMVRWLWCILLLLASVAGGTAQEKPAVRFGALADVQYADQATWGPRDYRASLGKLRRDVERLNGERLDFVMHLGDLADTGSDNLARIFAVWNGLRAPKHIVLGNHDFVGDRREVLALVGMDRAYYDFGLRGWCFVVLDGMNVSVGGGWPEESPPYREGRKMLETLREDLAPNAHDWNGAVGDEQLAWLRRTLAAARARGERAIVFCHFPVLAAASTRQHLLWDHEAVLGALESAGNVAAYINGHDHAGGYAERNGIHYLTVQGVVESGERNAGAVIELYRDRIEVRGWGTVPSRTLQLRR